MSQAVGTDPTSAGCKLPVNGPWLDNTDSHTRSGPYRTYGKDADVVDPGPSKLWVIVDEDADSINDAGFAVGCKTPEWIDWPGTYHNNACGFSFMDGHSEVHKWTDSRTKVVNHTVTRKNVSNPLSADWTWISERTSAKK
jgi:prepilin-type processing-associated H-X9-DG protein